jgi:hypothetical protein
MVKDWVLSPDVINMVRMPHVVTSSQHCSETSRELNNVRRKEGRKERKKGRRKERRKRKRRREVRREGQRKEKKGGIYIINIGKERN